MIRAITAAETYPLRQQILRPHQTLAEVGFDGDDDPSAAHFGAFAGEVLVGIASVLEQARPGAAPPAEGVWRVRGMATLPEVRGGGYGAKLLDACLEHARAHGGTTAWCNARVPAVDFYSRAGFRAEGGVFELPDIGPHVVMTRSLR